MNLSIHESRIGDLLVLGLSGEVDVSTVPRLSDALSRSMSRGTDVIVVDLDGITVLDDAALGILIGASARLRANGGELTIVVTDPRIRSYLIDTKVDDIISVHRSIDDVVRTRS